MAQEIGAAADFLRWQLQSLTPLAALEAVSQMLKMSKM
jgi:hypothetical protein